MAEGLIKYETIDAQQIQEVMSGKEPSPPEGWEAFKVVDNVVDNNKDQQGGDGEIKDPVTESI